MANTHSLSDCETKEKACFADAIFKRGKLTWGQLKQTSRKKLGFEKIARNAIKCGIPSAITPDTDIIAFRCIGEAPMVGFREGAVFHIVWIDRAFKLYKH